jgi:hypothetical protein
VSASAGGKSFWGEPTGVVAIVVAVIGALGAIVAALVGGDVINIAPGGAITTGPTPPPTVVTPSPPPTTPPPTETTPTRAPDPTPTFKVRRSTGNKLLTLSGEYSADLDSMDAAWDVERTTSGEDMDVLFYHGDLYAENGDLSIVSAAAKYETCRATTGYEESIYRTDLDPGLKVCFRTSEKRYAFVTVKKVSEARNQIELSVTVWEQKFE